MAGAHAGRGKKLILSQMTTGNNAKKTKMSRQRLGPSSPSGRSIHFGEGQAETSQAHQRLGVSCGLLSALPGCIVPVLWRHPKAWAVPESFPMPWGASDAPEAAHDRYWDKKLRVSQHSYKQSCEDRQNAGPEAGSLSAAPSSTSMGAHWQDGLRHQ